MTSTPYQPESETPPPSTLPYPPVHRDKKFIALSDWDGTITNRDTNDFLTDNLGFGVDKRRAGNLNVLEGKGTFRDEFRTMLQSVVANGHSFPECIEVLKKNIKLDPGFLNFYNYCKENDIPLIIISSGMAPLIRAILSTLLSPAAAEEIEIIANDVSIDPETGKWEIKYRHPTSGYGHDKSQAILRYKEVVRDDGSRPTVFFFGDGVSDISAARHSSLLFVKKKEGADNDLHAYCIKHEIPHVLFSDFDKALNVVKTVVNGEKSVDDVLANGKDAEDH
ncbi:HAD-like domain-containing protein [Abortiporus biennis]|nr:HAD-like domain-containing protein [Abortiporus biennis]